MNKPTREQIEHRAIELMLEEIKPDCTFCDYNEDQNNCAKYLCKSCLMKTALRKAEEELTKPKYFENEKRLNDFAISLERLTQATTHVYKYIKVCNKPVSHMRFYFELDKYDSIEGVWLCAELLKYNIAYPIKELLK